MNKASFKLKGLPPIYCINLDGEPHRWKAADDMLKYWEIENYTRISAYDGREDDLSDIIKGKYPDGMTCLLYTSPSPRDSDSSRMPSSA